MLTFCNTWHKGFWILLLIFLLHEIEMTQNNSVFVFVLNSSNNSYERLNLRIDINQLTNLKLLYFTWKK